MGWVGCDLDGTLAFMPRGENYRPDVIGPPIPRMVRLVKKMLLAGEDVRIFTARMSKSHSLQERAAAKAAIQLWCRAHLGRALPVTNEKDYDMVRLYDDRAIQVEHNTGRLIGLERR